MQSQAFPAPDSVGKGSIILSAAFGKSSQHISALADIDFAKAARRVPYLRLFLIFSLQIHYLHSGAKRFQEAPVKEIKNI
jgi:hypothetical protein